MILHASAKTNKDGSTTVEWVPLALPLAQPLHKAITREAGPVCSHVCRLLIEAGMREPRSVSSPACLLTEQAGARRDFS